MCEKENMNENAAEGGEEKGPRSLTRRGLLAGVGASVAGYLLSPCALAYADPGYDDRLGSGCVGNQDFQVPCEFSSNHDQAMYGGSSARSMSPVVRWGLSNWACGQGYLGAGIASSVKCRYENALFCFIAFEPTVKAYSRARWLSYYQGWHDIGQNTDNNYSLYFRIGNEEGADSPGAMVASVTCDLDLQNPPAGVAYYAEPVAEDSYHLQERYTYDYVKWDKMVDPNSVHGDARNLRKDANNIRTCDFRSRGYYYHFWCDIHKGGLDNGHSIGIDQDKENWLCQKVPRVEACRGGNAARPTCGIEWAGRIVAICDGNDTSKSLCVGDGSYAVDGDRGDLLAYAKGDDWPDATVRLNRNWYIHLNTTGVEEARSWSNSSSGKWRGTMSITNVMQLNLHGGGASRLDQDGGERVWPDAYICDAQTYNPNGGQANQAFWIHTGNNKQFIISDASGMMLEHPFADGATWCACKFHSNGEGLDSDVNHASHQWKLQDVIFKLRSGSELSLGTTKKGVGQTVSFQNIEKSTYPFVGAGSTRLRYEYMWVRVSDSDYGYLGDNVYVTGQACHEYLSRVWIKKPANNMLGALGVRALEGAALWVEGNKQSAGEIQYNFQVSGGNWDGTYVAEGALAGAKDEGRRNNAFVARLTGTLAQRYRVHYCAGNAAGWGDWKYDGELAYCPLNTEYPSIDAIRVEIVPRSVPGSSSEKTSAGAFSSANASYELASADEGKRIVGVARAVLPSTDFDEPTYLGYVRTSAVQVGEPKNRSYIVHYIIDGDEVFKDSFEQADYSFYDLSAPSGLIAGASDSDYDFWYYDASYKDKIDDDVFGFPIYEDTTDYYVYGRSKSKYVSVHYIVDGEEVDVDNWVFGKEYVIPDGYLSDSFWAIKDNCTFERWYLDSGFTRKPGGRGGTSFIPDTAGVSDYYLYARNVPKIVKRTITFEFTDETEKYFALHPPCIYPDLSVQADLSAMKPAGATVNDGDSFSPSWDGVRASAYVERTDGQGSMGTSLVRAVYTSKSATAATTPLSTPFTVRGDVTLYVRWSRPSYDGFDAS